MKLFNRKQEITSEHTAFLVIRNDHLVVDDTFDLSDLNYENLNALVEFAEDLHDLQYADTPEDIKNMAEYAEDEDE